MEFKLRLVADRPTDGELVLEAETPLSGMKFVETFGHCLRRSIDHIARSKHETLGSLVTYEMSVPQQMAIDSGLFEDTEMVTVIVENNLLSRYIFYLPTLMHHASGRPCYPYMQNEAILRSYIDELAFLAAWAETGYALRVGMNGDQLVAREFSENTDNDGCGIGCDGCTCGKDDKPPRPLMDPLTGRPGGPPPPRSSMSTDYPGCDHRPRKPVIPVGTITIGDYRFPPDIGNRPPFVN